MPRQNLSLRHFLLALSVVAVWGTNFVVIQVALATLPPLLFAALRFALVFFPFCLFLPRPAVPWRDLILYGLLIGVGQFGLLFVAMHGHITPGLASLVIQTQVFFTIFLSMRITGERVRPLQWLALMVAVCGIGVIMAHTDGSTTPLGLALILLAAASWAAGNMVARGSSQAASVNAVAYVVWSGVFAAIPLLVLSALFEGTAAIVHGLRSAGAGTWLAVAWQSVGNSLFGYAMWAWLLARYPAATVSPMALLVPVFGMAASSLLLAEPMPLWKLAAMALVMAGLGLNMLKR